MATKRFAEYRYIDDAKTAAAYRRSFAYYTEERLLASIFFYVTSCAIFLGIFIIRYRVELILLVPLAAGFISYYINLGFREDSPTQKPEKLHRERGFVCYVVLCAVMFVVLMLVHIPSLYDLFNVEPARIDPLWRIGESALPRAS